MALRRLRSGRARIAERPHGAAPSVSSACVRTWRAAASAEADGREREGNDVMHALRTLGLTAVMLLAAMPLAKADMLRIGLQADPATLDPAQSASFVDRIALGAACDKLVELDAKLA